MGFEKGHKKLPGAGMRKGQLARKTKNIATLVEWLLGNYSKKQIREDFSKLNARDRIEMITKLASKNVNVLAFISNGGSSKEIDNPIVKAIEEDAGSVIEIPAEDVTNVAKE